MPAGPYLPMGTTVRFNNILIGGLIGVSLPARSRGSAETTDSDSGFDRKFIAAIRDGGEVELTMRHKPDDPGQQELDQNYEELPSNATKSVVIATPDAATSGANGGTITFDAFVTQPPQGNLGLIDDEVVEVTCTLKVTGFVSILPS